MIASVAALAASVSARADTASFQDGVSPTAGYAGTGDTHIRSGAPNTVHGSLATLELDGDPDIAALLRWELSGIPAGSLVQSVAITLNVVDGTTQSYSIYELRRPWAEGSATWNVYSTGNPWQLAGAQGANDRGTTVLGTLGPASTGTQTFNLNAAGVALVQQWVNTPATNNGFVVQDYTRSNGLDFSSSEASPASLRPRLTVTYTPPTSTLPIVSVVATDANASEPGTDRGLFTISRTGSTTAPLTVQFTLGGSAVNGTDYSTITPPVTIAAGASSATIEVAPLNDSTVEGNETVVLTLATSTAYTVGSPASATVTIADDDAAPGPVTTSFQDGVAPSSGYAGTTDTRIWAGSPTTNFGTATLLEVDGDPDISSLLRWELVGIPAGSVVQSATITVNVENGTTQSYGIYELKRAWSESSATWNVYSSGNPWQVAGAQGANDRGTTVLGTAGPVSTGPRTITLNAAGIALVQQWLNSPATNNGLILQDYTRTDGLDFSSSESPTPSLRPRLTVTYTPPSGALPVVTVVATDANASEPGTDKGLFTISRSGSTTSSLTVNFTLGGTAVNGTDYTTLATSVTIPAGASSATVEVAPINDTAVEGNETVVLTLASSAAYTVGSPSSATISIADDDAGTGPVTTSFQDGVSPTTGYAGTRDTKIRSGAPNTNFGTATVLEVDGSPQVSTLLQWQLTGIPAGSLVQSASITLDVTDGTREDYPVYELKRAWSESSATWNVFSTGNPWQVAGAQGADDRGTTVLGAVGPASTGVRTFALNAAGIALVQRWLDSPATNDGVIVQDYSGNNGVDFSSSEVATATLRPKLTITYVAPTGTQPSVSVQATDADASEAGLDAGAFTITRTGSTTSSLTVNFTMGGTAVNGTDYEQITSPVTIAAGASTARVDVLPRGDTAAEGDETVVLTIASGTGYTVGTPSSATVTLHDSGGTTVSIVASDAAASEPGTNTGTFTVSRSGATGAPLVVNYTVGGTAINGTDYTAVTSSLTIPTGASSAPISIVPIDDVLVEGEQVVAITLAAGTGYVVGTSASANVAIADDEQPVASSTIAFQQGVAPTGAYSGATDTMIRSADANTNFGGADTLEVGATATKSALLRWDVSAIPAGSLVLSGAIVLNVTSSGATGGRFYDLKRNWSEGSATWNVYSTGNSWQVAGALGDDDRNPIFVGTLEQGLGAVTNVLNVDGVDMVQRWVDQPATNFGVAIQGGVSDTGTLAFSSKEASGAALRPRLTVTYVAPGPVPAVRIYVSDPIVRESGETGAIVVRRSGSTASPLTVGHAVEGTAINGVDYTAIPNSTTIPAGQSSATIPLVAIADTVEEDTESIVLTLSTSSSYAVSEQSSATAGIVGDAGCAAAGADTLAVLGLLTFVIARVRRGRGRN